MPLSEEELRLLEQMEQALAQEDPKFVSTLRGSSLERVARMRTIAAAVVFVVGVVMLMGGAVAQQIWLGVLGFVVMVGSATIGLASWRGRHAPAAQPQQQRGPALRLRRPPAPVRRDRRRSCRPSPQAAPYPEQSPSPSAPFHGQGPQAGHLHATHGAALGAPAPPGLLTARTPAPTLATPRAKQRPAHQRHRPQPTRQPRSRSTLPSITLRHDSTVATVRERTSGSTFGDLARRGRSGRARPARANPPATTTSSASASRTWPTTLCACSRGDLLLGPVQTEVERGGVQLGPGALGEMDRVVRGEAAATLRPAYDARTGAHQDEQPEEPGRPPGDRDRCRCRALVLGVAGSVLPSGVWLGRASALGAALGSAVLTSCRRPLRGRTRALAGRRLEAHPAHTGEVHLRPRVPVVAGVEDAAVGLLVPLQEADDHPRGNAQRATHCCHRGGELLAVPDPVVGDEVGEQVHPRAAALLQGVAEPAVATEPVLQRDGLLVVGRGAAASPPWPARVDDRPAGCRGPAVIDARIRVGAGAAPSRSPAVMLGVNDVAS